MEMEGEKELNEGRDRKKYREWERYMYIARDREKYIYRERNERIEKRDEGKIMIGKYW